MLAGFLQTKIPLLSDSHEWVVGPLGLVQHHRNGEPDNSIPAFFIVDKQGVVRWIFTSPYYRELPRPDTLLDAAKSVIAAESSTLQRRQHRRSSEAGESAPNIAPIDATPAGRAVGSSRREQLARALRRHAAQCKNRNRAGVARRFEPARAPRGPGGGFGQRIEDGAEDREVGALARRSGNVRRRMTRHPDEPPGPEQLARHADADGIERQMNPVGIRGNCHVDAIVQISGAPARVQIPRSRSASS